MQYAAALLALAVAVKASPVALPQGVTANVAPTAPAPAGCTPNYSGTFGIAVAAITGSPAPAKRAVQGGGEEQWADMPMATAVQQIGDGQIQHHTTTVGAVSQIGDGQIQNPTPAPAPVSQLPDGQPQQPPASSAAPVSAQPDGQPVATSSLSPSPSPSAPAPTGDDSDALVACASNTTLSLTLKDGILKDFAGRTGYIASNFQFQFDEPPQSGALFTSGFSVCGNGSLALGGSAVWYQCLSGDFYNLYDRWWAEQCEPVTIEAIELVNCDG